MSVKPGTRFLLEMYQHRAELWIVLQGMAIIERDGEKQLLGENRNTYIP